MAVLDDADLPPINSLMRKYRDFPMDFADATLVHTANRERISTVFTTDYSDFSAYRLSANRPFEIVPPR